MMYVLTNTRYIAHNSWQYDRYMNYDDEKIIIEYQKVLQFHNFMHVLSQLRMRDCSNTLQNTWIVSLWLTNHT